MEKNNLAIVVLAAGEGSRLKKVKQLLPYKTTTLLGQALQNALNVNPALVVCVLGAHSGEIKNANVIPEGVKTCLNPDWSSGMGSSIRCGIKKALELNPSLGAVLITLADQPHVSDAFLQQLMLLGTQNPEKMIATSYSESPGVPALFPNIYFSELMQLEGKTGAKKILQSNPEMVVQITPDFTNLDIDTPEDYQSLL